MIEGVQVQTLEPHVDERGRLLELFRADQPDAIEFGQVHISTLHPGSIKAWHRHRKQTDVLVCIAGTVRLGLFDGRKKSATEGQLNEFFLGDHSPLRITVPPGVWFGLKGVGTGESHVAVFTDRPYNPRDPDEERLDPLINDIPFDWDRRDR